MAERRMFAKSIIDSDAFIDMPVTARLLYYDLSMRADDDGFVNSPKKIMRMIGASQDDLSILILRKFIIPFESGVVVIKHWKIHNYIQKDRYKETVYKKEMSRLNLDSRNVYSLEEDTTLRQKALKESDLPYSFDYKIRQAFVGKKCPLCGCEMSYDNNLVTPTIQHNIPISKGGKHELGNISVICRSCNTSIQDNITGDLNADEVKEEWLKINCIQNVYETDTQVRLGKVSIGKDIKEKYKKEKSETVYDVIDEYTDNENLIKAIKDFIKFRKAIKAPLTDRALQLNLNKLDKLADTDEKKIAVINQSIEKGWKSLYELKQPIEQKEEKDASYFDKYNFVINDIPEN